MESEPDTDRFIGAHNIRFQVYMAFQSLSKDYFVV